MKQTKEKEYVEPNPSSKKHESVPMNDVIGQNRLQTAASVLAISKGDYRELLKDIRANGTKVIVMATADDKLFPIGRMAGRIEQDPNSITGKERVARELTKEYVDGFYSLRGTHVSYFSNPEKFAHIIDGAIKNLDKADEKKVEVEEV